MVSLRLNTTSPTTRTALRSITSVSVSPSLTQFGFRARRSHQHIAHTRSLAYLAGRGGFSAARKRKERKVYSFIFAGFIDVIFFYLIAKKNKRDAFSSHQATFRRKIFHCLFYFGKIFFEKKITFFGKTGTHHSRVNKRTHGRFLFPLWVRSQPKLQWQTNTRTHPPSLIAGSHTVVAICARKLSRIPDFDLMAPTFNSPLNIAYVRRKKNC